MGTDIRGALVERRYACGYYARGVPGTGSTRLRHARRLAGTGWQVELLNTGGSIATYATDSGTPKIPFWTMVFKNIRLCFLGSDDFPKDAKRLAAKDLNSALEAGWSGFEIAERTPLSEIARAHELVEHPTRRGRVVVIE